jgi:ferrochelatase
MTKNESPQDIPLIIKPTDHNSAKSGRVGVVLVNLGTPDDTDYWSMRKYLSEFLSDQRVINLPKLIWQPLLQGIILSTRPTRSGKAYRSIWNNEKDESPLKTITRAQCEKISARMNKAHPEIAVTWAMRYGNPSIKAAIDELSAQGCSKILFFALYPQYSATTTASVFDKAFEHLKTMRWQPAIRTSSPWYDREDYIDVLGASVEKTLAPLDNLPEYILASFHGLPKKYLEKGDPYHCMCVKNTRLLQERLNWPKDKFITTFQSRFGPAKWLEPYTEPTLIALAQRGVKRVAIISPAFVSDCIETLEELSIEAKKAFFAHGGEEFTYIPCLNDDDAHMDLLTAYIEQELQGWI